MTPREKVLAKYPLATVIRGPGGAVVIEDAAMADRALGSGGNATWAWYWAAQNIEKQEKRT